MFQSIFNIVERESGFKILLQRIELYQIERHSLQLFPLKAISEHVFAWIKLPKFFNYNFN